MESVHKISNRNWISRRINVKQFRDEWAAATNAAEGFESFKDVVDPQTYAETEIACGMDAMKCSFQNRLEITKDLHIPENVQLETLRLQKIDLEKRKASEVYDKAVNSYFRDTSYPPPKTPDFEDDLDVVEYAVIEKPEVLLCVQIFRPKAKADQFSKTHFKSAFKVDQEFLVLGSQNLTELRDKIECVSDKAVPGDFSDHPLVKPNETCGDTYKSGFFYIDGVFYNDMRHPDCRDYSQIIIDWSQNKNRGIGPFHKLPMEGTKFIDLTIQLGYPYLYNHQGNCEHLLVFSDLLMHTDYYSKNKRDYPLHVNLKPKKRVFCMICNIHSAWWIVYDNKRVPVNPFFFCKKCFISFNYDEKGHKIGDFRAYHHFDRSNIL